MASSNPLLKKRRGLADNPATLDLQSWLTPAKTARIQPAQAPSPIKQHNRYNNLPAVNSTAASSTKTAAPSTRKARIPPIILAVTGTHQAILDSIKTHVKNFTLKYTGKGNVSIHLATSEDHKTLIEGLKSATTPTPFHTFSTRETKPIKSVIKGLPVMTCEEIHKDLTAQGVPPIRVIKMTTRHESTSARYIVHFPSGTNIAQIKNIRFVCHTKITIERYRNAAPKFTQCFRCQLWGHASSNCFREPRCVKCMEAHPTSDCEKKDRESPAKCCGCGADHPANYRNCPRRQEYIRKVESNSVKTKMLSYTPKATDFPVFRSNVTPEQRSPAPALSYSDAVRPTPARTPPEAIPSPVQEPTGSLSTSEICRLLTVLKEIKDKASRCNDKLSLALMLVDYIDVLF